MNPNLSASTASQILAGIGSNWYNIQEKEMLIAGVAAAVLQANNFLPMVPVSAGRRDPREVEKESEREGLEPKGVVIHTDYEALRGITTESKRTTMPQISFTEDPNLATHWFHILQQKNFLNVPPNIILNQFPYEGGFVRKDLLPLTIRRHAYKTPGDPTTAPDWWLSCFDLSTEFHLFTEEFQRIKGVNNGTEVGMPLLGNKWVIKESQGTHSQGSKVVSTLKEASNYISCDINSDKEYIAQQLVETPLLVNGKKFDLRVWIFIRAFGNTQEDFEGFMSKFFHARVSNKAYDSEMLEDEEVFLTVSTYNSELKDGVRYTPSRLKEKVRVGEERQLERIDSKSNAPSYNITSNLRLVA